MRPSEPQRSGNRASFSPGGAKLGRSGLPELSAADIHIPELERKSEMARKRADKKLHAANPGAANAEGLNSSGLPSSQAYYKDRKQPIHTSAITPIADSKMWIKVLAIGCALIGFLCLKEAVYGLYLKSGMLAGAYHSLELIGAYFFFFKPARQLWKLCGTIEALEAERGEEAIGAVLYAHAQIWRYAGIALWGGLLFYGTVFALQKVAPFLRP